MVKFEVEELESAEIDATDVLLWIALFDATTLLPFNTPFSGCSFAFCASSMLQKSEMSVKSSESLVSSEVGKVLV